MSVHVYCEVKIFKICFAVTLVGVNGSVCGNVYQEKKQNSFRTLFKQQILNGVEPYVSLTVTHFEKVIFCVLHVYWFRYRWSSYHS